MTQPSTHHVFMSYNRKDEIVMRRVVTFLRKHGINVWVDNEKLVPGTPIWQVEIEKAIKSASAVVVLLSPDSNASIWVRREISFAERYHKRIFPALISGDEDTSVMLQLSTSQYVDIRENEDVGLNSLVVALSHYLDELTHAKEESKVAELEAARLKTEREAAEKAKLNAIIKDNIVPIVTSKDTGKADRNDRPSILIQEGRKLWISLIASMNFKNTRFTRILILCFTMLFLASMIGLAKSYKYLVTDPPSSNASYKINNLSLSTSAENFYATSSFTKGQDVYIHLYFYQQQADTIFKSRWYYQVNILGLKLYPMFTTMTYTPEGGINHFYFYLNKPTVKGSYRVDIYINDDLAGTQYFSVQ